MCISMCHIKFSISSFYLFQVVTVSASAPDTPFTNWLNYFVFEGTGENRTVVGTLVSHEYFKLLGVRLFTAGF